MKKTYKALSILLAIILIAGAVCAAPLTAYADTDPYHAMGTCGFPDPSKAEWYLFDDGSIAVFGTGETQSYSAPANANTPAAPWYINNPMEALMGSKIAIEDGITSVGDYSFYVPIMGYSFMLQTYNLDLPNSLTTIGAHAFENQNKLQKIAIPKNVTSIGKDAFKGCTSLKHVDLYCDPTSTGLLSSFPNGVTCHILPEYETQLTALQTAYPNLLFEANLHEDQGLIDDGFDRNIKGYFGTESSKIFAGAAPFVVVGTFSGMKKSVTHGNNGFVSCVKIGNDYYLQENNQSGHLLKATVNGTSGIAERMSGDPHALNLTITREYIGTNIVKMVYHLKNTGSSAVNDVMLGGTGDIKIGADDYAAIEPLMENNKQVGFYMKSHNEYDKSGEGENTKYATLGFIAKNVKIREDAETLSEPATFFYGKAEANKTESATGAYRLRLIPERIFTGNNSPESHYADSFNTDYSQDSGMSYFWNVGTVAAGDTKEYAVMFSVYGADNSTGGQEIIKEKTATYYTVTWQNSPEDILVKQVVKAGDTPVYPLGTPQKADTNQYYYTFDYWTTGDPLTQTEPGVCNGDITYTAHYMQHQKSFFKGHSLTLDGDIGVNFYMDAKVAGVTDERVQAGTDTITVKFSWFDKNSEYTVKTGNVDYDATRQYFKAQCNVAAAEMVYDIHAVAYINGSRYTAEEDHYSVRRYCDEVLNKESEFSVQYARDHSEEYPKLYDLAVKMLDYGAKSQIVFDRTHNVNGTSIPLANDGVKKYDGTNYAMLAHAIEGDMPDMTTDPDSGLEYYGSTIIFLTTTTLRHYYKVTDQGKFNALSNRSAFGQNGTLYYLEKENIPAAELDDKQTFNVGSTSYQYSALDFARKLQQSGRTDDEKALGTALYWYNQAANVFFNR